MANRRSQGGGWTDWTLDPSSNQYYRARQNWSGQWEYQYDQPAYPVTTHHQSAPRGASEGDAGVQDITSSFNTVSLQDTTYNHDQGDAQEDTNYSYTSHASNPMPAAVPSGPSQQPSYADSSLGYTASPYQDYSSGSYKGKHPAYDQYAPKTKGKGPANKKAKGKQVKGHNEGYAGEPVTDLDPDQPPFYEVGQNVPEADPAPGDYDESYQAPGEPATTYASEYPQNVPVDPVDDQSNPGTTHGESQEPYYPTVAEANPADQHEESQLDPNVAQAEEVPSNYSGSSDVYTAEDAQENYYHEMEADGYGTGVAEPLSSVAEDNVYEEGYNSYSYQRDTGQDTPRARSPEMAGFQYGGNTMNQTMSEGHYGTSRSHGDDLFSRYIVEPSSRFQPGSVFKIYWSEPLGDGLNATVRSYMDKKGEKFHYSFRRFIVVASDEGHSTCVPILTYGHRACTKRGVKAQKHGIVYQVGNRPFRLHMEPELGFPPARVELFERTEKLDKESRVNYSKLVTIEHNYRVFFIGRIHPGDFVNIVSPAVDTCWGKKRRHHR